MVMITDDAPIVPAHSAPTEIPQPQTYTFGKCSECGRTTPEGRRQWAEWSKDHPIWAKDMNLRRPIPEIIEELRTELTFTRGKIGDVGRAYTGFQESLQDVEGALTCALVALYNIKERAEGK